MKSNKILLSFVLLLIIAGLLVYNFLVGKDRSFDNLSGEIALMQADSPFEPLIIYNPRNKDTMERHDVLYSPSYNVNNSDHIAALVNENERHQHIYEIALRRSNPSDPDRTLIYTGEELKHPRFIPGQHAVSFIEQGKLCIFDIESRKRAELIGIGSPYEYDWLSTDTLLFLESGNLMSYDTATKNKAVFREHIDAWSLSINKKQFAYRSPDDISTVYMEQLDSGETNKITLLNKSMLQFKPSPDGKYLLASVSSPVGRSDVVIINAENLKSKVIFPSMLAVVLYWRE